MHELMINSSLSVDNSKRNFMSFLRYLKEYQFHESSQTKALRILEKRLRQKIGVVHRYGGPQGYQEATLSGVPYQNVLYFLPSGRALRVNISKFKWMSIDIWKKFSFKSPASITLDVSDLKNLAPAVDALIDKIKNPTPQDIPVYFGPDEPGAGILTEAKRTTPQAFFELFRSRLPDRDVSSVTWTDINIVAKENDLLVPSIFRNQKVSKDRYSLIPPGVSETGEVEDQAKLDAATKKGSEPILFIKVTAQDPVSKKFLPSGEISQAQDLYKKIQDSLKNGPVPERELKDVKTLFGRMIQLTQLVVKGTINSLLVAGGPGIGKTTDVIGTIKESGLSDGRDYIKLSGKATATSLYQVLYKWRKGGLIVLDDLDSIWSDQDATNILKAALDSYDERVITWSTGRTIDVSRMSPANREVFFDELDAQIEDDPSDSKIKYPSMFPFEGKVIFISNLPFSKFDTAILSRSAKIDMTLTQQQVFERMKSILPYLGGTSARIDQKEALLDHLIELYASKQMVSVTLREFVKGIKLLEGGVPNWKELLEFL